MWDEAPKPEGEFVRQRASALGGVSESELALILMGLGSKEMFPVTAKALIDAYPPKTKNKGPKRGSIFVEKKDE
jgi:hypothetical protein